MKRPGRKSRVGLEKKGGKKEKRGPQRDQQQIHFAGTLRTKEGLGNRSGGKRERYRKQAARTKKRPMAGRVGRIKKKKKKKRVGRTTKAQSVCPTTCAKGRGVKNFLRN